MLKNKSIAPEIFDVLANPMTQCLLIKTLLFEEEPKSHYAKSSDACPDVLKGKRIIELPNIRSAILSRVIEFCSYHEMKPFHEIKKPFETTDQFTNLVTEFDYNFIDQNHEIIFNASFANISIVFFYERIRFEHIDTIILYHEFFHLISINIHFPAIRIYISHKVHIHDVKTMAKHFIGYCFMEITNVWHLTIIQAKKRRNNKVMCFSYVTVFAEYDLILSTEHSFITMIGFTSENVGTIIDNQVFIIAF